MMELENETWRDMTKLRPGTRNGAKTLEKTVKTLEIDAKIIGSIVKNDLKVSGIDVRISGNIKRNGVMILEISAGNDIKKLESNARNDRRMLRSVISIVTRKP
jgi:hypothetical protein